MPRKYEMSWEPPAVRWVKMYKGVRHRVTCADLGLPRARWTKEESYRAANGWWTRKRAEIDGRDYPERVRGVLAGLSEEDLFDAEERGREAAMLATMRGWLADPVKAAFLAEFEKGTGLVSGMAGWVTPPPQAVDPDKAISHHAGKWLALKAEEAARQVRSAADARCLRICLGHFTVFVGPATVDTIDADLWERWWVHCAGRAAERDASGEAGWSADYARKVFSTAKGFVSWLWEREAIASLPRNFHSKKYNFSRPGKAIPTFDNGEVRLLLDNAPGQHRLHLLLMLNCGMTQKDLSDLLKTQIDLVAGTITRRRSKTRRQKHSPEVCYQLWPLTLALLREHLAPEGELALLTRDGTPWVRGAAGGRRSDGIAAGFARLRAKVGLVGEGKSLKVFRKTSATRLKSHKHYRDLRSYFLGHAAASVADRHYAAESQELLDEAVAWLGVQYGIN